jgi:hypothetical protein
MSALGSLSPLQLEALTSDGSVVRVARVEELTPSVSPLCKEAESRRSRFSSSRHTSPKVGEMGQHFQTPLSVAIEVY